jgi:multicomponent Na+:H+ antiporter subunit G
MTVTEILGLIVLWAGVFFCVVGVVGLIRFPDVYTRIHASGKVATLGLFGLLLGAAIFRPAFTLKEIALAVFMVLATPIASHAVARAAYRQGVPMANPARDDLAARAEAKGIPPDGDPS